MNDAVRLLSIEAGADRIGVSTFTVRRLMKAGAIKFVRVGRRILIPQAEVERIVADGCGMGNGKLDLVPVPVPELALQVEA
jgi:excisionase family DNA binding protein